MYRQATPIARSAQVRASRGSTKPTPPPPTRMTRNASHASLEGTKAMDRRATRTFRCAMALALLERFNPMRRRGIRTAQSARGASLGSSSHRRTRRLATQTVESARDNALRGSGRRLRALPPIHNAYHAPRDDGVKTQVSRAPTISALDDARLESGARQRG